MAAVSEKPLMICHVEKPLNYTLYDCKWIPKSAKFAVIGSQPRGTGTIEIFEVASNDLTSVKKIETAHSLKCGTFGAVGKGVRELATGDFNGHVQIHDLETSKTIYDVKGHDEIVNCIDGIGSPGPPELATGSRDGSVKIWDIRQREKPVTTIDPSEGEMKRDCWAVAFGNSYSPIERMVGSGYDNGDVKLFDLRQMKLIWEKNLKNGICGLEFDRKDIQINKLVVATLESKFHVFDCRTLHPVKGFAGVAEKAHKSTIWLGKHLPQNRDVFMTAGGNGGLSLWNYRYPSKRVKKDTEGLDMGVMGSVELLQNVTISTQPISSFDWSPDKMGLAVGTSFDQCVRLIIVTKLNLI